MFEIGFLCPNSGKKWKREELGEKTDFGAERNGLLANQFLKWNCLLLFLSFLYFSLVLSGC